MTKVDKPEEIPFKILHPNVRQLLQDLVLVLQLRYILTTDESLTNVLNISELKKTVDALMDFNVSEAVKALVQLHKLDAKRMERNNDTTYQ